MTRRPGRIAGLLALACIFVLALLRGKPEFSNASQPARGISDPVIALQLARSVQEVDDVLGESPSPDREAMRLKQYIDFAFIASYVALYLALAALFHSRLAIVMAICGAAAGTFDVIENLAILRIIDVPLTKTTQATIDAIRHPSLAKWALAFVATAIAGWLFWRAGGRIMRVIGALDLAAAALGFYGLYDNAALVWAGLPLFAALIVLAFAGILGRIKGA